MLERGAERRLASALSAVYAQTAPHIGRTARAAASAELLRRFYKRELLLAEALEAKFEGGARGGDQALSLAAELSSGSGGGGNDRDDVNDNANDDNGPPRSPMADRGEEKQKEGRLQQELTAALAAVRAAADALYTTRSAMDTFTSPRSHRPQAKPTSPRRHSRIGEDEGEDEGEHGLCSSGAEGDANAHVRKLW